MMQLHKNMMRSRFAAMHSILCVSFLRHALCALRHALCPIDIAFRASKPSEPQQPSLSPRASGFTLIEVLVSLAILSIALVAVVKSMLIVQDHLLETKTENTQAMLCAQKMEEIRSQGVEEIVAWEGSFEEHPGYRWSLDIQPGGAEELKMVRIEVHPEHEPDSGSLLQELFFTGSMVEE